MGYYLYAFVGLFSFRFSACLSRDSEIPLRSESLRPTGELNTPRFKEICPLLAIYATSTGWETCTYEGRGH